MRGLGARAQDDPLDLGGDVSEARFARLAQLDEIVWDYRTSAHSTRGHPLAPLRGELRAQDWPDARTVRAVATASASSTSGIVICRQQPGTASRRDVHDARGRDRLREPGGVEAGVRAVTHVLARTTSFFGVSGKLQVQEGIVHLIAEEVWQPQLPAPSKSAAATSTDAHERAFYRRYGGASAFDVVHACAICRRMRVWTRLLYGVVFVSSLCADRLSS